MIKAILLDLDDTLLRNPNQGFVPRYLQLIDEFFRRRWGTPISQTLLNSVPLMSATRDIEHTNLQFVLDLLQQTTGQSDTELHDALHEFYMDIYPALRACTQPVRGAPELVAALKEQGYAIVIATNPIYPEEAIRQRLIWAGLSGSFDDYAFVTRADNMHFAKPNPAYYAEILGRIGVEPDEAVMIGDSLRNDMEPASIIGLHTIHVTLPPLPTAEDLYELHGELEKLDTLLPKDIQPASIIPQWQGNLGALFGIVTGIKPHFWNQHPDPEEWSPLQIVCHLLERESTVHRHRLERILTENNPFIPDPGLPLGPHDAVACDEDGYRATQRFLLARLETIHLVQMLRDDEWERPARHSIFGPTTLLEMALFTAQHDRLHLKQLCQTTGKCS